MPLVSLCDLYNRRITSLTVERCRLVLPNFLDPLHAFDFTNVEDQPQIHPRGYPSRCSRVSLLSASECRYCDISAAECYERVDIGSSSEETTTEDF